MYVELHLDKKVAKQLSSTFFQKEEANQVLKELLSIAQASNRVVPFTFSLYNDKKKQSAFWSLSADSYEIGGRNIIENFDWYFEEDVKKFSDDKDEISKLLAYYYGAKTTETTDGPDAVNLSDDKKKRSSFFSRFKKTEGETDSTELPDETISDKQEEARVTELPEIVETNNLSDPLLEKSGKNIKGKLFFVSTMTVIFVAVSIFCVLAFVPKAPKVSKASIVSTSEKQQVKNDKLIQSVVDKQEKGTTIEVEQKNKVVLVITKDEKGNTKITYKD